MAGDATNTEGDETHVGYGRPPKSTRFRKGQSGNPAGKLKGTRNRRDFPGEQLRALLLKEAYRPVKVKVGRKEVTMPLAQAVIRSLTDAATKGEARAQTTFFKMLSASEAEAAAAAKEETPDEMPEPEVPEFEIQIVDVVDGRPVPAEVIYPDELEENGEGTRTGG
ncbi:hypothetical protein G5V57_12805 [Nordella sp. HKS 07]|uniref:DUF5681 domain-containing protein n=1 Tax=Nordella sp. HKS 07 TaxID=2712222 RepID=UPI0013E1809A|nr:DUF5681 domain-containing protein [Nordella sp. HKS 07]QIG48527.1 hypothetical protein G5V57_12805 [Nordella sp. HKS 07]